VHGEEHGEGHREQPNGSVLSVSAQVPRKGVLSADQKPNAEARREAEDPGGRESDSDPLFRKWGMNAHSFPLVFSVFFSAFSSVASVSPW